ncbi:MAG TPA: hypothetical protein VGP93_04985, partial [Polyangiaceae bacterium]|nr:hypothetical protein [Polyangiaceae bacterium]
KLEPAGIDDAELWSIIEHAFARQREARYASMTEFGKALAIWLVSKGVHHDITGAPLESRWLVAGRNSQRYLPAPASPPSALEPGIRRAGGSSEALALSSEREQPPRRWKRRLTAGAASVALCLIAAMMLLSLVRRGQAAGPIVDTAAFFTRDLPTSGQAPEPAARPPAALPVPVPAPIPSVRAPAPKLVAPPRAAVASRRRVQIEAAKLAPDLMPPY